MGERDHDVRAYGVLHQPAVGAFDQDDREKVQWHHPAVTVHVLRSFVGRAVLYLHRKIGRIHRQARNVYREVHVHGHARKIHHNRLSLPFLQVASLGA